jgi:hypothetical protein
MSTPAKSLLWLVPLLLEFGLQMSGFQSKVVGYTLILSSLGLLLWAGRDWWRALKRLRFRSPLFMPSEPMPVMSLPARDEAGNPDATARLNKELAAAKDRITMLERGTDEGGNPILTAAELALRNELSKTRREIQQLTHERDHNSEVCQERTVELLAVQERLSQTIAERDQWQRDAEGTLEELRYGFQLPRVEPHNETNQAIMQSRVCELLPNIKGLAAAAERVWSSLKSRVGSSDMQNPVFWLMLDRDQTQYARFTQATTELLGGLKDDKDARPILMCFYVCYRRWREWAIRLAEIMKVDLDDLTGYAEWRESDLKFFEDLTSKLAIPQLARINQEVVNYITFRGHPPELPLPSVGKRAVREYIQKTYVRPSQRKKGGISRRIISPVSEDSGTFEPGDEDAFAEATKDKPASYFKRLLDLGVIEGRWGPDS